MVYSGVTDSPFVSPPGIGGEKAPLFKEEGEYWLKKLWLKLIIIGA
jgi:hypothetical protein